MPLKAFDEFIWKHVLNNFTAKVMALAMALGLWFFAYLRSYTEWAVFEIPVHVHASEGWSVGQGENLQVRAKLSYPSRFEDQFKQELNAGKTYFDCNVAPEQSALDHDIVKVTLKRDLLVTSRDFSLKIDSFNPSQLSIELIRETARMVPVLPKTSAPPPGYLVEYAFPYTSAVMIKGQEDIIAQLAKTGIETQEIDISSPPPGNKDEWDRQVQAHIPSSVTIGDKSYPVTCADLVPCLIHLARVPVERRFTEVPIELLVPPGYSYVATTLRENTTEVLVTGSKSDVDALKKENIILYVDVRDPKLVPQETPYTQPICAQIVDQNQRPKVTDMVVKPAISTCAIKISEAKPK